MALHKRMGRVKPEPFKRKSISISLEPGKQRTWKTVSAINIEPGDTIVDLGLVEGKSVPESGLYITLTNIHGDSKSFLPSDEVLAFQ